MELTADKKAKNKAYYLANKDKFKQASKLRREAGLEKRNILTARKRNIKQTYGLNWEEYLQLLETANYSCQICHKPLQAVSTKKDVVESASIDHCHITGKVRGVLCRSCNVALGHFKDSRLHLLNAVNYLDTHGIIG